MKNLLIISMCLMSSWVMAQERLSKEIFRNSFEIEVKLDETTVRCSAVGYGVPELKVDVPALDWAASFQHRNLGEGQPCMTAGRCTQTRSPELILRNGSGTDKAQLEVVHTEEGYINASTGTCHRRLVETVKMTLRGETFSHRRDAALADTTADSCLENLQ